jgi:hypothetical protein
LTNTSYTVWNLSSYTRSGKSPWHFDFDQPFNLLGTLSEYFGVIGWLKDLKLLFRRGRGKKYCNRNGEIRRLAAWKPSSVRLIVCRDSVMRIPI